MTPPRPSTCSTCGDVMTDLGVLDDERGVAGGVLYGCSSCGNAVTWSDEDESGV